MYPFWEVPFFTSGLVIALIATFHILPCHLATGAFWFNVYVERKAYKQNRPELLEFIKKFSLLILIFCFVIGSLSGVGIWYAATVASPRGISGLIHNYVWGWATEWVFFIIEIAAIYVYYYTIGKIDPKSHLMLGWLYAWAAWISMVIITGILAFMLSAGKWVETGGFFDGFFNETYWPQLFTRTAFMFGIAGVYAAIVASTIKNKKVKDEIIRTAGLWGVVGMLAGVVFAAWYLYKLPPHAKELWLDESLPYLSHLINIAALAYAIVFVWFVICCIVKPKLAGPVSGVIILLVLFMGIGAGEGFREGIRRPYIIDQYMYGNQIVARDIPAKHIKAEIPKFDKEGFLTHLFFKPDKIDPENSRDLLLAGNVIVHHQCGNCHALDRFGKLRPLPELLENLSPESPEDIEGLLESLGDYPYMPPFAGNDLDRKAASEYLFSIVRR
ncbi:MAG: cytochrome C [Thermodesulfobacteria bacterium]|nr:cytochrome C [Thermodesulfobacteriota bacterium]